MSVGRGCCPPWGSGGERTQDLRERGRRPAGTAAGAQVSNPRCRFVIWLTFSLRSFAWRDLQSLRWQTWSETRGPDCSHWINVTWIKSRNEWPAPHQLGAPLIGKLIGLRKKGASCCLVVVFVDHLWQAGASKLNWLIRVWLSALSHSDFPPLLADERKTP